MHRCSHLYESGRQCESEAFAGSDFCEDHGGAGAPVAESERLEDHPMQKLAIRLVAVVLLLIFLIPFYYTVKTLYLNLSVEAQEAG